MEQEIGRCTAVADDGTMYTVITYQHFTRSNLISGPQQWIPGTKHMALLNGESVNYIDDETFQIVQTDEIIRKVS